MHALNHDGNLLYVELAADKDADSDDREQWLKRIPAIRNVQANRQSCACATTCRTIHSVVSAWHMGRDRHRIRHQPRPVEGRRNRDVPDGGTVSFGIDMRPTGAC